MNPAPTYQTVSVDLIDTTDTTFLLRPALPASPDPDLLASIRKFGILQPPLLARHEDGHLCVLSGRRRIMAVRQLQVDEITGLVVASTIPKKDLLVLLLQHALMGSSLSIIEQALFLNRAARWLDQEERLLFLSLLGHKPQPFKIRELEALLVLDRAAIMGLHQGTVHPKTGNRLARLSAEDQRQLVRLITDLRLGGSKQQKLVTLCTELIMRRGQPLTKILATITPAVEEKTDNIPQQATALLHRLQQACFPRSSAAEQKFRKFCRSLNLPPQVEVTHTPAFEDDRLRLCIECDNWEQLKKRWAGISPHISQRP